ncbi:DJ-1/PfpI family protein [Streptomyces broussonetiae]|uniref:Glutamine amidotransferase n=1 Tax=Streptomyces broussonetiae TaxID=2686304 RepID=A0A6I6N5M6_9ACTN|nr:DJ-1/PfpI family protein [Streptomyces broussonetiae]QHA05949.1 glutamine amidotransferase [Streptomyces broussonetiae]
MNASTGKRVHLAVYDSLADWETGHTTAYLARAGYEVLTVGPGREPVVSIGGLRITPDLVLDELCPEDSSLLILPGADLWTRPAASPVAAGTNGLAPFARAARAFLDAGVPVAAICGATAGLAREGLLDERAHTSASPYYLAGVTGYAGGERYVETDAVTDGALITAGPTEPVALAREVFRLLGVYEGEVLDAWYRLYHDSDAEAYHVLQRAGTP